MKAAGATGLAWFASGGSPGEYVRATDVQDNQSWCWRAPNKFRGNHDDLYGKYLTYDQIQTVLTAQSNGNDVTLTGGTGAGLTLQLAFPVNPGNTWTPYAVRLTEAGGWRVKGTNAVPTATQFHNVLSNVRELLIRGEFTSNTGKGLLDNVRFGGGAPWLTITNAAKYEGTGALVLTVSLSHITAKAVTVNFTTADGTAQAGSDYVGASGLLTFSTGQLTKTISVGFIGDTVEEGNETFTVNLTSATNAAVAHSLGLATIIDDD
jgi:hypothetical protein